MCLWHAKHEAQAKMSSSFFLLSLLRIVLISLHSIEELLKYFRQQSQGSNENSNYISNTILMCDISPNNQRHGMAMARHLTDHEPIRGMRWR